MKRRTFLQLAIATLVAAVSRPALADNNPEPEPRRRLWTLDKSMVTTGGLLGDVSVGFMPAEPMELWRALADDGLTVRMVDGRLKVVPDNRIAVSADGRVEINGRLMAAHSAGDIRVIDRFRMDSVGIHYSPLGINPAEALRVIDETPLYRHHRTPAWS
jgi:hypothetical protein